ncbi:MAG: SUMF1/EgtB/PvdO family nonheme iron enzyme, partial [Alphaproteobacteria bacterium]|nr:SUMF1/EgtB/PvdO family nonheme iron enzyme [Alphaproteobacteria bacterium]
AVASALESWLTANGFSDIFIDHQAIAGGDKWREALRTSAGSARVVVCLVTANWLASDQCMGEFRAAWYMGKRIIPLFLLLPDAKPDERSKERLKEVMAEDQGVDLWPCVKDNKFNLNGDEAVTARLAAGLRAAGALARIGLDPEAFNIDKKLRPTPFPGLSAFGDEDADAALFYGRSKEIAQTLEILRSIRAMGEPWPLVILGASGSGKSSLLKAGILPRLRRESPAWLPLRAFRPGADPLLNFAEALATTQGDFGKSEAHGVIRRTLFDAWSVAERDEKGELNDAGNEALRGALEAEGQKLRKAANRPAATILISVDQAEEIARSEGDSGDALADYLKVAISSTASNWQLAFTTRTDSFPELQSHQRFQNLETRGYDLRAIPIFRFDNVVEQPAKRYGVEVGVQLVDTLMEDAPKQDALPLLAFALQRLWRRFAASGTLREADYNDMGGLKGLIEDAAERALRGIEPEQDVPLPVGALPKRLDELGASTFVPPLAQINDSGETIRRISRWDSFSEDQKDLLNRYDHWRLVVRKGSINENSGDTVEVAHEALFREWDRLRDWLEPERARLESLRGVKAAARTWERHDRIEAYLDHRDARLTEALALSDNADFARQLADLEGDYLTACNKAECKEKSARRRMKAAVGVLGLGLIAGGVGFWKQDLLKAQYHYQVNVKPYVWTPDQEAALKPKDPFTECASEKLCPTMIVIPAGSFMMGSVKGKGDSNEHGADGGQVKVTIAKPFAVSKYEVTFNQWNICVENGACIAASNSGWKGGDRPVINVSWHGAKNYVKWLSELTRQNYRLLSEAE